MVISFSLHVLSAGCRKSLTNPVVSNSPLFNAICGDIAAFGHLLKKNRNADIRISTVPGVGSSFLKQVPLSNHGMETRWAKNLSHDARIDEQSKMKISGSRNDLMQERKITNSQLSVTPISGTGDAVWAKSQVRLADLDR